jgi:hypothetical protein
VGVVSRQGRHKPKDQPTPKRAAQGRRRALLWAVAKHTGNRRQWRGAVALFTLMVNRWSDDDAKGVFPSQVRMAAELGCCDRQIRRYLDLLIGAGFLTVMPGKRHPQPEGTWYRSNNLYLFRFPAKKSPAHTDRTPVSAHPPSERKNPPSQAAAGHPTIDIPANKPLAATPQPSSTRQENKIPPHWRLLDDTPNDVTGTEETYRRPKPGEAGYRVAPARQGLAEARSRAQFHH